jgi:hypothetical protein
LLGGIELVGAGVVIVLAVNDSDGDIAIANEAPTLGMCRASVLIRSGDSQLSGTVRFCRHGTDGMRDPEFVG